MTEKRFTIQGIGISDHKKKRLYDLQTIDGFISVRDELNALHEEKEFWKSNCCTQDNFNSILLNELSIAQEQGYKLSDPFKKLMEEKEDL